MVSDISRLLADKGFGPRPIDIVEALVFAMFIIADTYSLANPDQDQAREVIHGFYDDMQNYFIKKVIIEDHKITDAPRFSRSRINFMISAVAGLRSMGKNSNRIFPTPRPCHARPR